MAHKCKANAADPWRSKINGASEGDITIETEGSDGRFTGTHKDLNNQDRPLHGRCYEASGPLPDRIWFEVPDLDYLYVGVIYPDGKRVDGTRFTVSRSERERILQGDEDWVGTKT